METRNVNNDPSPVDFDPCPKSCPHERTWIKYYMKDYSVSAVKCLDCDANLSDLGLA